MESIEMSSNRWLDLPGAAAYCALPVKTLRRAIASGDIPFAKPGRKQILDRRDLDSWLMGLKHRMEV